MYVTRAILLTVFFGFTFGAPASRPGQQDFSASETEVGEPLEASVSGTATIQSPVNFAGPPTDISGMMLITTPSPSLSKGGSVTIACGKLCVIEGVKVKGYERERKFKIEKFVAYLFGQSHPVEDEHGEYQPKMETEHHPETVEEHHPKTEEHHPETEEEHHPETEEEHYPKTEEEHYPKTEEEHYPKTEEEHYPKTEEEHYPKTEEEHYPKTEEEHHPETEEEHHPETEKEHHRPELEMEMPHQPEQHAMEGQPEREREIHRQPQHTSSIKRKRDRH